MFFRDFDRDNLKNLLLDGELDFGYKNQCDVEVCIS
jgi:hypothetical protein